jgi:type III pantothenate kinase
LGIDRWLAALAVHHICPQKSVLLATLGTATTLDIIKNQQFCGGMIVPGLRLMLNALHQNTAQLPSIKPTKNNVKGWPDQTEQAIQMGCLTAQVGAIEQSFMRLQAEVNVGQSVLLLAGGDADLVGAYLSVPWQALTQPVMLGLGLVVCNLFVS